MPGPDRILTVAQVMRPIRHTLPTSASVLQALALIWENRLDALVLISPGGEVAGIVSEFELWQQIAAVPESER